MLGEGVWVGFAITADGHSSHQLTTLSTWDEQASGRGIKFCQVWALTTVRDANRHGTCHRIATAGTLWAKLEERC